MEFNGSVKGETFAFTPVNEKTFLVTGNDKAYILYKTSKWNCADEIPSHLLKKLGEIIEEYNLKSSPQH